MNLTCPNCAEVNESKYERLVANPQSFWLDCDYCDRSIPKSLWVPRVMNWTLLDDIVYETKYSRRKVLRLIRRGQVTICKTSNVSDRRLILQPRQQVFEGDWLHVQADYRSRGDEITCCHTWVVSFKKYVFNGEQSSIALNTKHRG